MVTCKDAGMKRLVGAVGFGTLLLDLAATTVIIPLLPTYHLSMTQTSLVFLAKPVAEMLSNLAAIGPGFADCFGPRRPAMLGLILVAVGSVLLIDLKGTTHQGLLLVLGRALGGLGASLSVPALLKLISMTFADDGETRDQVTAFALAGDALGGVVGPVIGSALYDVAQHAGAADDLSRAVPLLTISTLCAVCAVALSFVPETTPIASAGPEAAPRVAPLTLGQILSKRGIGAVAIAALAFGATAVHIGLLESTTPMLLIHSGTTKSGYYWAFVGLGFALTASQGIRIASCLLRPNMYMCCSGCLLREPSDSEMSAGVEGGDASGASGKATGTTTDDVAPASGASGTGKATGTTTAGATSRAQSSLPFRYSWASAGIGALLLLQYSVTLYVATAHVPTVYFSSMEENAAPPLPMWYLVTFGVCMALLGLALGFIYVPLNALTQDLTLALLDQTAMARMLGFLQGAKNCGLVVGYVLGPALVNRGSGPSGFLDGAVVLISTACVVLVSSLALRSPLRGAADQAGEASALLPAESGGALW